MYYGGGGGGGGPAAAAGLAFDLMKVIRHLFPEWVVRVKLEERSEAMSRRLRL